MNERPTPGPVFALSTNWNSARHQSGAAIADEILALGFDALELGYSLDEALTAEIVRRVRQDALRVTSVHAFCPAPLHVVGGHPELYLAASLDDDERAMAVLLAGKSLELACDTGARAVVLHAGRVRPPRWWWRAPTSEKLIEIATLSGRDTPLFQKLAARAAAVRRHCVPRHLQALRRSLDTLLPRFVNAGVTLCLENLPSWEALPNEAEIVALVSDYQTSALAAWHDMGHAQIRQHLGWCDDHLATAQTLLPLTRGIHIHDVQGLACDHQLPGTGVIDFSRFAFYGHSELIRVFEPAPETPAADLARSLTMLRKLWNTA